MENHNNMENDKIISSSTTQNEKGATVADNSHEATNKKVPLLWLGGGIIIAFILALLTHFFLLPALANGKAQNELSHVGENNGKVQILNSKLVTFANGQKIENVNVDQKALGVNEKDATTPAGYIFTNGKGNPKKTVEVYLDFTTQASRDFILMNRNNLTTMIESGAIKFVVRPVPTGNAFTIYASEALAESAYTSPDKTWDFMLELLRAAAVMNSDNKDDIVKAVVDTANTVGVQGVDAASIKNGTFTSWLITVGSDPRLAQRFYPPLVFVNGKIIDATTVNFNDPTAVRKAILEA